MSKLLIKYGELVLKGKNRKNFVETLVQSVRNKTDDLDVKYQKLHDRMYIMYNDEDFEELKSRMMLVFGIHSFVQIYQTDTDIEAIKQKAIEVAKMDRTPRTFKVESRRGDKTYPMTSIEMSRSIAGAVLSETDYLTVDVHDPEYVLHVEVRRDGAYVYGPKYKGLGGLPQNSQGKGLLLLSGGIDSPVAAFQMMKRGMEVDCIHFESSPLTPVESVQKVVDLAKKLSLYAPKKGIRVFMVPFRELHVKILEEVSDAYTITIMRRMMYRIAEKYGIMLHSKALITGESLGQVASQTIESMETINDVIHMPVLRPLIANDKEEIIQIARQIDTFDISTRPFEDCCTVYVPKQPVTRPTVKRAELEEQFAFEELIDQAIEGIKLFKIKPDSEIDLPGEGFLL